MTIWQHLGLDGPTDNKRAIKKAYAAKLKVTNPEDDASAFQVLREAYQEAISQCEYANWHTAPAVIELKPKPEPELKPKPEPKPNSEPELKPEPEAAPEPQALTDDQQPWQDMAVDLCKLALNDSAAAIQQLDQWLNNEIGSLIAQEYFETALLEAMIQHFSVNKVPTPEFFDAVLSHFGPPTHNHLNKLNAREQALVESLKSLRAASYFWSELHILEQQPYGKLQQEMREVIQLLRGNSCATLNWDNITEHPFYSQALWQIYQCLSDASHIVIHHFIPDPVLFWLGPPVPEAEQPSRLMNQRFVEEDQAEDSKLPPPSLWKHMLNTLYGLALLGAIIWAWRTFS